METSSPKIVIIGAGSLFFGRKLIWAMNRLDGLTNGTLGLVDTDAGHLAAMENLAHLAKRESGSGYRVEASTDFRDVLPGADFVVLSFSHRNAHFRGVDCRVSEQFGIRMCSGDTIGPGGIFRALRELPHVIEIADAVEALCPEAWVVNYINPSTVLGMALKRHGRTRNFAMCDSLHLPYLKRDYMRLIGLDPQHEAEFSMTIAGVNHFTWMLSARFGERDVLEDIRAALEVQGLDEDPGAPAKALFNKRISAELGRIFGAVPVCTAHTKEYVPYFQGYGPLVDQESVPPLKIFEHEDRERITAEMWAEVAAYGRGDRPISEFLERGSSDHATDAIQAIWQNSGRHLFINVPNGNSVVNLPSDALLELECRMARTGPEPLPAAPMPLGLRALQQQILDTHELTVEGFFRKDRDLILRALAVDPLVNSLACAEGVLAALYEEQKELLGDWMAPSTRTVPTGNSRQMEEAVHQGQTRIF